MSISLSKRKGMMIVISSPSGAGKTTLCKLLLDAVKNIKMSVSVTTRQKRMGEVNGVDYFFVSKEQFNEMKNNNAFLEYAEVFDNYYGTERKQVEILLNQGIDVLFDIDWQGAQQLNAKMPEEVVRIFILPPSMGELEKRLRSRNKDNDEVINKRMLAAKDEISHYHEYDYVLINHDLDDTHIHLLNIISAERSKRIRQIGLKEFVENL